MPKQHKKEFTKLELNEKNIQLYIDLLTKIKMPFVLEVSNYTTRITSENYNIYFVKNEQSLRTFAAAAKVKADLQRVKNPPEIDINKVSYFDTNFKSEFFSDVCYNIDLKSAYATILYNDGFITGKTYKYLCSLDKMERLAAVGMCASRKEIFTFDKNGNIKSYSENVNPLSCFFFYCVQKTGNIIKDLRQQIFKDCFLFSWVDSVYYLNHNENYKTITQSYLLEEYKIESTFKILSDFEVRLKPEFYKISFLEQNKKGEFKKKVFNVPYPETELKRKIVNYLLTKKYNSNDRRII